MIKFAEFAFHGTYRFAGSIRARIFSEDPLENGSEFFQLDSVFEAKALAPSKTTFLHDFIMYWVREDVSWCIDKLDPEEFILDEIVPLLDTYRVPFKQLSDFVLPLGEHAEDKEYLWACQIKEIFFQEAAPRLAQEVFTLIFPDRELLKQFNERIAGMIKLLKCADHPKLLVADGKVARCMYWPTWLKNGLVFRDKGRCAICLTDLSGVLVAGVEVAIDHIVPLHQGGTNDPTNLQILCASCNGKKGGSSSTTSSYQHLYWDG